MAPAPLIALLDFPRIEDVERARSAGAAAVLSKPLQLEDLFWHLERVVAAGDTQGPPQVIPVDASPGVPTDRFASRAGLGIPRYGLAAGFVSAWAARASPAIARGGPSAWPDRRPDRRRSARPAGRQAAWPRRGGWPLAAAPARRARPAGRPPTGPPPGRSCPRRSGLERLDDALDAELLFGVQLGVVELLQVAGDHGAAGPQRAIGRLAPAEVVVGQLPDQLGPMLPAGDLARGRQPQQLGFQRGVVWSVGRARGKVAAGAAGARRRPSARS